MRRRAAKPSEAAAREPRRSILVVDDDIVVGMTLSIGLPSADIIEASSPADGWRRIRERRPDAVIVDRRFPNAEGLDMVRQLRADATTSDLPIIVLTAAFDEADRDTVAAAGADIYLGKPFEPEELFALVLELLLRPRDHAAVAPAPASAPTPPPPPAAPTPAPPVRRSPLLAARPLAPVPRITQASDADEELQLAREANTRLTRHIATIEAELDEVRSRQAAVEDAKPRRSSELADARKAISELEGRLAAAEATAREVEQLRRELASAYQEIDRLQAGAGARGTKKVPAKKVPAKKRPPAAKKAPAKRAGAPAKKRGSPQ